MKIGIDIRLIGKKQTGSEAVFFNLVKNLADINRGGLTSTDKEYFLYTDNDPEKNSDLKSEIEKLRLSNKFKIVFLNSPNRFWWNLWALPNYLRKNPVDVFHTQYIAPFWLPKNVKLVLTIHDISFNFFPKFIKFSDLLFLKTLIPRSLRMASKIIAVSSFTKNEIEKYYHIPADNVVSIHNGVDFELFNQAIAQEIREEVRKKYNLPEKFLLYIGTLQPRKNIPVLIESLKILNEKYNQEGIRLVIAGNRKAHNFDLKINEAISKYNLQDSVIFPGWIDGEDKPALYKLAQCFVFPSLYEGFGIPIIEAMAAGVPVVSSNSSCLPEVGKDGALYADQKKPEEFAKIIQEVLSDENLRKDLIAKGSETAKNYTWQKNAQKTLELYKNL
ncbi:MAG TPA: glycosyltransferase family 1 protein [Candidatus Bathyarchaeia archaeon]|nr:glycosyltransferase family 1 protein [Candidatus Bathyarchaeia archaeon]